MEPHRLQRKQEEPSPPGLAERSEQHRLRPGSGGHRPREPRRRVRRAAGALRKGRHGDPGPEARTARDPVEYGRLRGGPHGAQAAVAGQGDGLQLAAESDGGQDSGSDVQNGRGRQAGGNFVIILIFKFPPK